jgi:hypothetical protein
MSGKSQLKLLSFVEISAEISDNEKLDKFLIRNSLIPGETYSRT